MSTHARWLWPSNESRLLRYRHYQHVTYESYVGADEDILLSGSDDELDPYQRRTKKRRIECLAEQYLSGKPLFIPSAALKGPFEKGPRRIKDKYASYVVGSPLIPQPEPITISKVAGPKSRTAVINAQKGRLSNEARVVQTDLDESDSEASEDDWLDQAMRPPQLFAAHPQVTRQTPEPPSDDDADSLPASATGTPSRPPQSSPNREGLIASITSPQLLSEGQQNDQAVDPQEDNRPVKPISPDQPRIENVQKRGHHGPSPTVYQLPKSEHDHELQSEHEPWTANSHSSQAHIFEDCAKSSPMVTVLDVTAPTGFTPINKPPIQPRSLQNSAPMINQHVATDTGNGVPGESLRDGRPTTVAQAIPKSKGKLPKIRSAKGTRRNRYVEAVDTGNDSPLMIRRKHAPHPNTAMSSLDAVTVSKSDGPSCRSWQSSSKSTDNGQTSLLTHTRCSSKQALSQSNGSDPLPTASNNSPGKNIPPAIDISFDQGSLAMNFDFIDRHTNSLLPASGSAKFRKSVSVNLRRAMRESGASFTASPFSQRSRTVENLASPSTTKDVTVTSGEPLTVDKKNGVEEMRTTQEGFPQLSTQAAMEQAHRALFDTSSPLQPRVDLIPSRRTPEVKHRASLCAVAITPFHEFNAQIAAKSPTELKSQVPNTQALFDNMSPFLSPEKPTEGVFKSQQQKGRSLSPSMEVGSDALSPSSTSTPLRSSTGRVGKAPPVVPQVLIEVSGERAHHNGSNASPDGIDVKCTGTAREPANATDIDRDNGCNISRMSSSSPDVIFSQRSAPSHGSQREQPSLLPAQSICLTDILSGYGSGSGSHMDYDTLFNIDNTNASRSKNRSSGHSTSRRSSEKSRNSKSRSIRRDGPQLSSSQPVTSSQRSLRLRASLLQPEQDTQPWSSLPGTISERSQPSGKVVDEAAPKTSIQLSSSSVPSKSCQDRTASQTAFGINSAPPASTTSKKPSSTAASSHQPAQRVDIQDLDSTIDSITHSVLSPWDVEVAMTRHVDASAG